MQITKSMDKVARSKIHNLCHHHRKERVRGDIERDTKKQICASLIKLTTELAALCVKLEKEMTRRQRHLVDFYRIPRGHYQAAALRICFDLRDPVIDLVHPYSVRATPVAPLRSIDDTEVAGFISPLVPDPHTMLVEITNIRVAAQKPKQFINDRLGMQLFCCEQRESWPVWTQIKSGLRTKDR